MGRTQPQYDHGISPSIAISTMKVDADSKSVSVVIECHQSQNNETLLNRVGKVDADKKTIAWGSRNGGEYDSGTSPSIAINNNFMIVEVHETGSSAVGYLVGTVQHQQ